MTYDVVDFSLRFTKSNKKLQQFFDVAEWLFNGIQG